MAFSKAIRGSLANTSFTFAVLLKNIMAEEVGKGHLNVDSSISLTYYKIACIFPKVY